jgi:hypothetical protein
MLGYLFLFGSVAFVLGFFWILFGPIVALLITCAAVVVLVVVKRIDGGL